MAFFFLTEFIAVKKLFQEKSVVDWVGGTMMQRKG